MTAQVVRLRRETHGMASAPIPRSVLDQLHGLLSLDPIAGVSATRTLFVVSEDAKTRLVAHVAPPEREAALAAPALAIIAFDFLYAVSLLLAANPDCAAAIRTAQRSAGLQADTLKLAAGAVGLKAHPIASFDAAALRTEFFAGAEATVVGLCRLAPEATLIATSAFEDLA